MGDNEEIDSSHIKLHQITTFPQASLVKTSYQPKVLGGTTAVIVSTATTHLQTTSTQVSRITTLPIQAGPAANYHVPRGAAAVANMAAPRSSVATPVLRAPSQPHPIGTRTVLPAGVQTPRQPAKISAHHVGAMRGRGVTVANKQQQVVSGRLLGPTLVPAPRPPHSTNISSSVLTKPVMLSTSTMVRGALPGQSSAKIFQTADAKIYQQTDQTSTIGKLYQDQSSAQKMYQQSADQSTTTSKVYQTDQSTTTSKMFQTDQSPSIKHYQTDQSTSTPPKIYQPSLPEGTTVKVFHTTDQTGTIQAKLFHATDQPTVTSAKIFTQTDQGTQPSQQPVFIHHKPQIGKYFSGSMYVSQTGGSGASGGVVVASGMAQTHGAVVVPHGGTVQHHGSVATQHGTLVQQHSSALNQPHTTVLQPQQMTHSGVSQQNHGAVVQTGHGAMLAQHVTVAQHQGTAVLQAHAGVAQQAHAAVVQSPHTLVQQHGSVVQHGTVLQAQPSPHAQQHSSPMVQGHVGLVSAHGPVVHQATHSGVSHSAVSQPHSLVTGPQSHGIVATQHGTTTIQPNSQTSQYIEISRQVVRPSASPSQASTSIHQQSSSCQVVRFNPVVVVEAGRAQTFQAGLLSASSSGSGTAESATLTALPHQGLVQPNIQGIAMTSTQPVSSQPHIPLVPVTQQMSISTSVGQITAHSVPQSIASSLAAGSLSNVTLPPASLAQGSLGTGSLTVSSIPQSFSSAVAQSLTPKQNTSPRPSILRKRDSDSWSGSLKAQRNLGPVLSSLNLVTPPPTLPGSIQSGSNSVLVQTPVTPQCHPTPDDDAPPGSGGSSTLSAASSPDQPPIIDQPSPATSISAIISASSPRKKPRKQQLPHNPPPSRPSPFSDEDMQFLSDKPISNSKSDYLEEDKKKRMSLLKTYRQGWKPTHNHFVRYCEVRCKEEKKPTLTELANQKNALNLINGWKLCHLLSQIEDMVSSETEYCDLFTSLLTTMEEKQQKIKNKNPDKKTDELLNRLNERIKANAQRCKVVNDHMHEARGQFMKLFEHKSHVTDLVHRFVNKRPIKKRERV